METQRLKNMVSRRKYVTHENIVGPFIRTLAEKNATRMLKRNA